MNVEKSMNALQFSNALTEIWKLIGECNRYIDLTTPWVLAKNEADRPRLGTVLYVLAEGCAYCGCAYRADHAAYAGTYFCADWRNR